MATVAELLAQRTRLQAVSDSAALDTELLLCHCLQKSRAYLRGWSDANVEEDAERRFQQLLARREKGEPVAYLIGMRGFWSLDLQVSPATLIPRPETELLVEKALTLLPQLSIAAVLDLGTGTGAIALALASEQPQWHILGSDVEADAVSLAQRNLHSLRLGGAAMDNVSFVQSDWFAAIEPRAYDLIISNPPYIDPDDPHLQQGDVQFEPRSALVSQDSGLADIKRIVAAAPQYLAAGGWLLLEHGFEQGAAVQSILARQNFIELFTDQDLAGHGRISGGRLP